MQLIDIVMITDGNYVMPTCVAIASMYHNKRPTTTYHVHVFTHNVDAMGIDKIESMTRPGMNVSVIADYQMPIDESKVNIERHVSTAALLKFYIPEILKDAHKALYIDSDILVQSDLSELWDTDISDAYAGVVKDTMSILGKHGHLKRLNYPHEFYFNSGVLLLNLDKMRKDDMTQKLIDYRMNGINHFMDQDALNVVLGSNVVFMPLKYNCLNYYFTVMSIDDLSKMYDETLPQTAEENYKSAVILHLGGKEKPWTHTLAYLTPLYCKYARFIGWKPKVHSVRYHKAKRRMYRLLSHITVGNTGKKFKRKYKAMQKF